MLEGLFEFGHYDLDFGWEKVMEMTIFVYFFELSQTSSHLSPSDVYVLFFSFLSIMYKDLCDLTRGVEVHDVR